MNILLPTDTNRWGYCQQEAEKAFTKMVVTEMFSKRELQFNSPELSEAALVKKKRDQIVKIIHEDIIDTVKQYLFDKEDIGIRLAINSGLRLDKKLLQKIHQIINSRDIMSKIVKILREGNMLSKENEVEKIAKEIDSMGRSSRKGRQKNRNRKQKKGNSTKPVEEDTTLEVNDNNNSEKNIEREMSLDLVEPSPSLVSSSEDPSGEGESTDDEKWQTVQSRSKRVTDRELESSSASSQVSSGASAVSEVPSPSASISKKKRRKRHRKQVKRDTAAPEAAEVTCTCGRTIDSRNSENEFQNRVMQALTSIQDSNSDLRTLIVKKIDDLRRDVTKEITVSQMVALSS